MPAALALKLLDLAIVGLTYMAARSEVQDRTLLRLSEARATAEREGFDAIPPEQWLEILADAEAAAQDAVNRLAAVPIPQGTDPA